MTKKISKVLNLSLAISLLGVSACAVEPMDSQDLMDEGEVRSGEQELGSVKARVDIWDWNGLVAMQSDGNYRLRADINASGKTWTVKNFSGTFDGNGKTISNLTINGNGGVAGFFQRLDQAIVKNIRFSNMNVTGGLVGGIAGLGQESLISRVAVEGTLTSTATVGGGLLGLMYGGNVTQSYVKGTVRGAKMSIGGLVGQTASSVTRATITESYVQGAVIADVTDTAATISAGGIVGYGFSVDIHDVYAVGDVTGRRAVGGLVGALACDPYTSWLLYRGIYRGDVHDRSVPAPGWAGVVGTWANCSGRIGHLFFDKSLDTSPTKAPNFTQTAGTSTELRSPTGITSGIYCLQPGRCDADGAFEATVWTAGTSTQHHALLNVTGPNPQPR
jgi:hypothetical protein